MLKFIVPLMFTLCIISAYASDNDGCCKKYCCTQVGLERALDLLNPAVTILCIGGIGAIGGAIVGAALENSAHIAGATVVGIAAGALGIPALIGGSAGILWVCEKTCCKPKEDDIPATPPNPE